MKETVAVVRTAWRSSIRNCEVCRMARKKLGNGSSPSPIPIARYSCARSICTGGC